MDEKELRQLAVETSEQKECLRCGCCCQMFRLGGGKRVEDLNVNSQVDWRDKQIFMRVCTVTKEDENGVWYKCSMCVKNPYTGQYDCLIHDARPQTCVDFVPGGPKAYGDCVEEQ